MKIVNLLISTGININYQNSNGYTALMMGRLRIFIKK